MATPDGNGKGESGVTHINVDMVTLTYDRARDHLDVKFVCNSLDLALDMLGRARRWLEAQVRVQQALDLQRQMQQAAHDQAIADAVRNRR